MQAVELYTFQSILGEGPIWHAAKKTCYWVDIEQGILYGYDWLTQQTSTWQFAYKLTMVIECTGDHLLLALDTSLARFTPETGQLDWLVDIEPGISAHRCNDGASDSKGRLWAGTMHRQHLHEAGSLYCIDEQLTVTKKVEKVSISNGLAWSLDNKRLYYIDSPTQKVQCYLFDEETGDIVFEKTAIDIPAELGGPDGMTIDAEGMLWVAHWGGFGVYRWNPLTGELLTKIAVPAPHVTSCAFAGENLDYLLITTARENMTEEALAQYPQSGNTFIAQPGVKGVDACKCAL